MARGKKRPTIRGNLIKVGIVFAIGAAIAIVLPMLGEGYKPLVPDEFDPEFQKAKREAPENAFYAVEEAATLMPAIPDAVRPDIESETGRLWRLAEVKFSPALHNLLGVAAGPAPGPMTDHLLACTSAAAKIREAVTKTYYLMPEPPDLSWGGRRRHMQSLELAVQVTAHGAALTNDPATMREGLETLVACAKLSRMIWRDEMGQFMLSRGIEELAAGALCQAITKPGIEEHLPWLLQEWSAMGAPFRQRMDVLHAYWRNIDNTMLYSSGEEIPFGRQVELTVFRLEVQSWADGIQQHREPLEALALLPPSRHDPILEQQPRLAEWSRRDRQLQWNVALLRQAADFDTYYTRTLLAIALERHRFEQGNYPAQLAGLAPGYLDPLPKDPINNLPFHYETSDAGYLLRSIGLNETNDQGGGDDYLVLNLFAAAV
jgi:hypothetical protein